MATKNDERVVGAINQFLKAYDDLVLVTTVAIFRLRTKLTDEELTKIITNSNKFHDIVSKDAKKEEKQDIAKLVEEYFTEIEVPATEENIQGYLMAMRDVEMATTIAYQGDVAEEE